MDDLTRAVVDRRPRLTESRLRQLELAFAQHWIKQPLCVDGLQLIEELRRARSALITVGHRAAIQLAARGDPERGEGGADDLHHTLDTVAEGLGVSGVATPSAEERAPAPAWGKE
jgi:hypothetical protein